MWPMLLFSGILVCSDELGPTGRSGQKSSSRTVPQSKIKSAPPLNNAEELFPFANRSPRDASTSSPRSAASRFPARQAAREAEEELESFIARVPLAPPKGPVPAAGLQPTGELLPGQPIRWFLMRELQGTWLGAFLDDSRLFVNGWIEQSFTASTDGISNSTVVWNDRANRYLLQQAWVSIGRRVEATGTSEPTFGFQLDILNGSDYRFTLPRGLFNSQLDSSTPGSQNLYGVDPIQEYVSAFVPGFFHGTEFRFGRVFTPWGMESLKAVDTPLLSRSYAFNWAPPFTHCGLEALVAFNAEWSGVFMLANGNDVYFGDPSEELRFVGNIQWVQPGGRNSVVLATSFGRGRFNPAYATPPNQTTVALATEPFGRNNFNAFDLVYTHNFSPIFHYNLEAIYGYQTNVPQAALAVGSGNGFANWFSAAQYLFYTFSPKWTGVVRYENFDDCQGQRTGFAGLYMALTTGLQYHFNSSIVVRPELRYDYNFLQAPFEGKHGIFTAASDLIIRW